MYFPENPDSNDRSNTRASLTWPLGLTDNMMGGGRHRVGMVIRQPFHVARKERRQAERQILFCPAGITRKSSKKNMQGLKYEPRVLACNYQQENV
jgi:hypothetical protein